MSRPIPMPQEVTGDSNGTYRLEGDRRRVRDSVLNSRAVQGQWDKKLSSVAGKESVEVKMLSTLDLPCSLISQSWM